MTRRPTTPALRSRDAESRRGAAPPVAVALLVLLAVGLAGVVAAGVGGIGPPAPPPRPALELSADADSDRVALLHLGGDPIDVRELTLRVAVGGTPLAHQPPVPFFAARGFRAGPTGPFNTAADPRWTAGETASLRLASTNAPLLSPGVRVRAALYVRGQLVARLTVEAS